MLGRQNYGVADCRFMATKKKPAADKVAMDVTPEPLDQGDGGQNAPVSASQDDVTTEQADDVTVIIPDVMDATPAGGAPAAPAPAPTGTGGAAPAAPAPATTPGAGPQPPSTIAIPVGSAGYYTGARPAETKAQYEARLGTAANTFADLGWILGTAPKV